MKTEIDDPIRQSATAFIRQHVAMGFDDADTIHGAALDHLAAECDFEILEPYLGRLTRELLAEHIRAQDAWPAETDCDRLDFAFLVLEEEQGIVARQHFTCCQTDGHNDIWLEVREAQQHGPVTGYVFYHQQDTETAVQHGKLFLAFGAVQESDAATCEIGRRIVQALRDAGLSVEWSGSPRERAVVKLNWQKRRTP